jgi:hypothetical protein
VEVPPKGRRPGGGSGAGPLPHTGSCSSLYDIPRQLVEARAEASRLRNRNDSGYENVVVKRPDK